LDADENCEFDPLLFTVVEGISITDILILLFIFGLHLRLFSSTVNEI
jgi:hypothetical protein